MLKVKDEKHTSGCECCSDKKSQVAKVSRNTKVSVKYIGGMVKREVKYKLVEDDLKLNQCILIE
jgi:hydrogenase maturation factor|tara:strand:- start:404 stop:595 length:192 start_codon:yes stop_codon:yes gene_type:complete